MNTANNPRTHQHVPLTDAQRELAQFLRIVRPICYDRSNVIIDGHAREAWFQLVNYHMAAQRLDRMSVNLFCDIAGVPD